MKVWLKKRIVKIVETYFDLRISPSKEFPGREDLKTIAVIITSPLGIGDLVMAGPFFVSLRTALPDAQITLFTNRNIAPGYKEIDEVVVLRGSHNEIATQMRTHAGGYDLAIVPEIGINQAWYARCLKPRRLIGYVGKKFMLRSDFRFKRNIVPFTGQEHFAELSLKVIDALEFQRIYQYPEPVFPKETIQRVNEKSRSLGIRGGRFLFVNAQVLWETRAWAKERYVELLMRIGNEIPCVLVGGPDAKERNAFISGELRKKNIPFIDATAAFTTEEYLLFIKKAGLYLTADSGPMHLAYLMGVPTLALFGPINPDFRKPLEKSRISRFKAIWPDVYRKFAADYDYESRYENRELEGLRQITVDEVEQEIRKFFKRMRF